MKIIKIMLVCIIAATLHCYTNVLMADDEQQNPLLTMTGWELLDKLEIKPGEDPKKASEDRLFAVMLLSGMLFAFDGENYCKPEKANIGQAVEIVKKYLKENPEVQHISASSIILFSLEDAWPCFDR